ncbi:MAG: phosphate/phosphite/phosphonate ABC transporter substrate-binding protein [Spirochaetales bacterium]|nr:phosphate/phosphite/phosphonate ABC transporter substrate-binding protein [Spirochaetales bacterium]
MKNIIIFLVVGVLLFFSCSQDARTIKFAALGLEKNQTVEETTALYKPLMDYLSKNTKQNFVVQIGSGYDEVLQWLIKGEVQFCILSPVLYIQAKKTDPNIELLVTELQMNPDKTKKIDSYLGYIVALKTRDDITDIQSLKGKKFGFVDKGSSSGFKYPNAMLKSMNIDYETFFGETLFLGSHPNVTDAVTQGKIDAGATWDFNLTKAVEKDGDIYKVIYTTPPIPNLCMTAHPSLTPELTAKVRELLVNVSPEVLSGLQAVGYVVRDDSFYDIVRKL